MISEPRNPNLEAHRHDFSSSSFLYLSSHLYSSTYFFQHLIPFNYCYPIETELFAFKARAVATVSGKSLLNSPKRKNIYDPDLDQPKHSLLRLWCDHLFVMSGFPSGSGEGSNNGLNSLLAQLRQQQSKPPTLEPSYS
jgi:hypothetical protein